MKKLAIVNAKVYVEREKFAEAVYCEDGFIKLVGSNDEVKAAAGEDCKVIDLGGKVLIPGFNDSHCHLMGVGANLERCNIKLATSIEGLIKMLKEFAAAHPESCAKGIQARGFNEDFFTDEKRMPNRYDLDKISTEVPIMLRRACGHKISCNSKALELAGIGKGFGQVPNGDIWYDEDGEPTGIMAEQANRLIQAVFEPFDDNDYDRQFDTATKYALQYGITSVQSNDVSDTVDDWDAAFRVIEKYYKDGRTPLRYYMQVCAKTPQQFKAQLAPGGFHYGRHNGHDLQFEIGPLKVIKDGTLGGRTATMRNGYKDDPGNYGFDVVDQDKFEEMCRIADANNIGVAAHCIGDKAVEDAINAYEAVLRDGKNPLRHNIIHCQVTDMPLLERIKKDDLVAGVQPIFLHFDLHSMITRCEDELSSTSYAFNTMEEMGIHVGYGTDAPVEDLNPYTGLYSAVTRKDLNGWPEEGWWPNECVDIYRAVDAYTVGSAYCEFKEDVKGRIKPGFVADFAVPDKDIFTIDPMDLRDVKTLMTVIGGEVVFER